MGTISEKLVYLNETKQAIATAIENKGVTITSDATFRSYADSISSIQTGSSAFPVGDVTNLVGSFGDGKALIKWTDPENLVYEGFTLATWAGTKLVRKLGSYPTSETDGTLVIDNTVKNQYSSSAYVDSGLINETTYYYALFPYTTDNVYNYNTTNCITIIPSIYKIFGVRIDTTNSNPETSVTYTDNAIGMVAGSSDWDSLNIFKDIKPCVLLNGVVNYYLDPNDYTKKIDGTDSNITSGTDGDVMIEFKKFAYLIYTEGNYIYVKITDRPNIKDIDNRYCFYSFTRSTEGDKNYCYIGAYLGYNLSTKTRSLSGKTFTENLSFAVFRNYSRNNGTGYDLIGFYQVIMLQCLYLIKYKNLDSQTALGRGFTDNTTYSATGNTNQLGQYYGENTGKIQMKFAGIEDLWGNAMSYVDGVRTDSTFKLFTAFDNFNTEANYTDKGTLVTSNLNGYNSAVQGNNKMGFIGKSTSGGSSTTYYCDYSQVYASKYLAFGGALNQDYYAGIFHLRFNYDKSTNYSVSGRLMYL